MEHPIPRARLCGPEAAIINVTTNENYTQIENTKPGDRMLIPPGSYAFAIIGLTQPHHDL